MKILLFLLIALLSFSCSQVNDEPQPEQQQKQTSTLLKKKYDVMYSCIAVNKQLAYVSTYGSAKIKCAVSWDNDANGILDTLTTKHSMFPFGCGFNSDKVKDLFFEIEPTDIRTPSDVIACTISVDGLVVASDTIRKSDLFKKVVYLRYKIVE